MAITSPGGQVLEIVQKNDRFAERTTIRRSPLHRVPNARKSIGITVFSGMLASTLLAVLFVPSFFVVVQRIAQRRAARRRHLAASVPAE
jgi:hypothetical protein